MLSRMLLGRTNHLLHFLDSVRAAIFLNMSFQVAPVCVTNIVLFYHPIAVCYKAIAIKIKKIKIKMKIKCAKQTNKYNTYLPIRTFINLVSVWAG